MIIYVDTSTLLKRLLHEAGSDRGEVIWESADVLTSAVIVVVGGDQRRTCRDSCSPR